MYQDISKGQTNHVRPWEFVRSLARRRSSGGDYSVCRVLLRGASFRRQELALTWDCWSWPEESSMARTHSGRDTATDPG